MNHIFEALRAPFPSSCVKWRVGKKEGNLGQALPYIDSRDVQERLDTVVGPDSWEAYIKPSSLGVVAAIRINCRGVWVTKEDGAHIDHFRDSSGSSSAKELAVKGAFSDAIKRAAVLWGIGRYLYAYKAPMVPITENDEFVEQPVLPAEFLPQSEREALASPELAQSMSKQASVEPQKGGEAAVVAKTSAKDMRPSANVETASTDAATQEQPAKQEGTASQTTSSKATAEPAKADAVAQKETVSTKNAYASAKNGDEPTLEGSKANASAPAVTKEQDTRQAATDALADAHAAANAAPAEQPASVGEATQAQATAAPVKQQDAAPATTTGTLVINGYDVSHLEMTAAEQEFLKELLDKVGVLSAAMLTTYINGTKAKQRLNETARQWVLDVIAQLAESKAQAA